MSPRGGSVFALLALVIATATLGYAAWMSWKLQDSLSVLAKTQERDLKEMMISLAHTEGQLGRVKEAMNAFDLQKWLGAVQGPLVDRLEEKMSAVQRTVVREEVTKSVQQITRQQADHWQVFAKSMAGAKAEIAKQAGVTDRLEETLTRLIHDNEALAKKRQEAIQAQFVLVLQHSKEVHDRLSRADEPTAQLKAELTEIKEQNQALREALEQWSVADREHQEQVQDNLTLFAEAMANQETTTLEQRMHWQGLFTTLRENHEAELESNRSMIRRFEEERTLLQEKVNSVAAESQRGSGPSGDTGREVVEERLGKLREFCVRRPESVLCRDIDIR